MPEWRVNQWVLIFVPATAALCAYGTISILRAVTARHPDVLCDIPNARSLHSSPTPRIGGIGILVSVAAVSVASFALSDGATEPWQWCVLASSALLFLTSLADDAMNLPIFVRLCVQFAASVMLVACDLLPADWRGLNGLPVLAATLVTFVWVTNAFNFMDGADGLAGGMALIGFAAFAWAATSPNVAAPAVTTIAAAIAGATVGFLALNFAPAKVFMGDAGSVPLGFLAVALSWIGFIRGHWPWWFGFAVFSAFLVDATVTLCRRISAGKTPWQAHREHYYQRLILSGWSHRKTCFAYYILMLASAICALLAKNSPHPWTWLLPLVITYASLIAVLEWRFHQEKKDGKKSGTG
jgi:UDP-N-acetylmuramyl pentapeptide phosphotransferase/UDP-N-acetylglucosamine-1-phosphate transferase